MTAQDVIIKKRGTFIRDENGNQVLNGNTTLSREEIEFLVKGYVQGTIPDYQVSAFLMAVYFNGMTFEETGILTDCMLHSGDVIELHGEKYEKIGLKGPFVDKHSTGGVGDKISIPLAPIAASCGVQIPMMSGRALGHTGGTLDKLESIEGYRVGLSPDEFRKFIAENGYGMTGQTKEIVPADRLLYALRDVTGTVESVPLITASILSKKVAEGSDCLVFDVKWGTGAFMKSKADAEHLSSFLVNTAKAMGKKAVALITDMNSPLGRKIGNFLEIEESVECLQGKGPLDVMELTYVLAEEMILLSEKAGTKEEARKMAEDAVKSGKALECFLKNVKAQGGNPEKLMGEIGKRRSPHSISLKAEKDGFIKIDAFALGLTGIELGVGRRKTTDPVFADAGIILEKTTGESVKKGEVIMNIYGQNEECLLPALEKLKGAVEYSQSEPEKHQLIYKTIR